MRISRLITSTLYAASFFSVMPGGYASAAHSRVAHRKIPFASWVGRKFVFLKDPLADQQACYYEQFTVTNTHGGKPASAYVNPDQGLFYKKFAGKTIACIAAGPETITFHVPDYNIDIACSLVTYTDGQRDKDLMETVDGLAPADEIEKVKSAYLGQTVWALGRSGRSPAFVYPFDPAKHKVTSGSRVDIPGGTKFSVTGVEWGDNYTTPVWIVVTTESGDYYCYEVAADRTNKVERFDTMPLVTADGVLSKTPPDDAVASDNAQDGPIATFSGTTNQETDVFTIPPGHTGYIVWSSSPAVVDGQNDDGNFIAEIRKAGDNSLVQAVANVIGKKSGATNCYHQGKFYLDVDAQENWTIKVYVR